MIRIDPSQRGTLADQIVAELRRLVDEGELRPESRLPSIRRFATAHGVSKFTVVQAYDRLVASGHVRSRPGAGFFASRPARPVDPNGGGGRPGEENLDPWMVQDHTCGLHMKHWPGSGRLPSRWLEDGGLDRAMRRVLRRGANAILGTGGTPRGFNPLRGSVTRELAGLGIDAAPDQILLTNGITNGIDLVGRILIRPGDLVLVDDPGYPRTFEHLRALGASMKGVPWTGTGPDPEQLESIARTFGPRLLVTTPIVQNPTGRSFSEGTAFRVLQVAERYDFHVIENDVFGTLHPAPPPRLASLDQLNRVIYVNGLSRALSPSLQVGYLAGHPDLVRDLAELQLLTQAASAELTERLVHEVLAQGQYRKHLARLRSSIQFARDRALRRLEALGLGPAEDNAHGLFAWMEVPGVTDTQPLAEAALERGMLLAPGAMFSPDPTESTKLRFNVAYCQDPETLRRLGSLLDGSSTAASSRWDDRRAGGATSASPPRGAPGRGAVRRG